MMLTPAQQKIRRELEELQVKGLLHEKDEHPNMKRRTKSVWIFLSLAFLLLAGAILAWPYYKGGGHLKVNQYLLDVYRLEHKSSQLLDKQASLASGLHGTDKVSISNLGALQKLTDQVKKLQAPRGFEAHKQDLIAVLEQRAAAIKSPSKRNLVTLDVKKGLARDSLAKALANEKVKYRVLDDDTIQFWINKNVYQY